MMRRSAKTDADTTNRKMAMAGLEPATPAL